MEPFHMLQQLPVYQPPQLMRAEMPSFLELVSDILFRFPLFLEISNFF